MKLIDLPVGVIQVGDRTRQEFRNVESLARSISERGLLSPVNVRIVDGATRLVCGARRLRAVRDLGWIDVPALVIESDMDELEALLAEGEENTEREPFTPAEAVCPTKAHEHTTRHRTSKAAGYGHSTLDKAEKIIEAAESDTTPGPVRAVARAGAADLAQPGAKVDRAHKALQAARSAHDYTTRYPDLGHYQADPAKVTSLGRALDAMTPTEQAHRLTNLAKTVAAAQREPQTPATPPGPDHYAKADAIFQAANRLARTIVTEGGTDTVAAALDTADPLMVDVWRGEYQDLAVTLGGLAAATRHTLRSIK